MSTLQTIENDVVSVAKKFKAGLEVAGEDALKVASFLQSNQALVTGLAALAGSSATNVTNTGVKLINLAATAIEGAGSAADANGVSISLDAAVVAEIKALIAAVKSL